MKSRLFIAAVAVVAAVALPAAARAEVTLEPMASSPLTDTGQGGMIEPVDLNGDGLDDLAVGSAQGDGGVRIRLATPAGAWTARPTLLPGQGISDILGGDLDGDDEADLLLTTFPPVPGGHSSFHLFRGNGDGTFQPATQIGASGEPIVPIPTGQAILPADWEGDGDEDLVMALPGGRIGLATNDGEGNFAPFESGVLPGAPTGDDEGFATIASGDFNGDGHTDLALGLIGDVYGTSDADNSGLFVIYWTSETSRETVHIPAAEPFGTVMRLLVDDLDGDGTDDLVAASIDPQGEADTRLLFYQGGEHGIAEEPAPSLATLPGPFHGLVGADLNGDGDLDLAWPEVGGGPNPPRTTNLAMAIRSGDDGFIRQALSPALGFGANQDVPAWIESGDFNGDGAPDVATSFHSSNCALNPCGVSVLTSRPSITVAGGPIDFGTVNKGSAPASRSFTITNHGGAPAEVGAASVSGPGAGAFTVGGGCDVIDPGESCSPSVSLATGTAGSFTATVTHSITGVPGTFDVQVSGTVVNHHGTFDRTALDFGDVQLGSAARSETVTLTADGESGLSVGQLTLGGPGASGFALGADTCSDKTLASGQSCSFDVTTALTSPGPALASVSVPSNGQDTASTVTLSANALPAPTYRAALKLSGPKKVKPGRKFSVKSLVTNTGTGGLAGLTLRFKATQGKATRAQGRQRLPAIAPGRKLNRALKVAIPRRKLARGKPVVVRVNLIRNGRSIAARALSVKPVFPRAKRGRR